MIQKKLNSRLYCLRKLRSFNVNTAILASFYNSVICSVWGYCLICWGGNVSKATRQPLDKIIKRAGRIIGQCQESLDSVYQQRICSKLVGVMGDCSHPLHDTFQSKMIPRSGRLRAVNSGTDRYKNSFVPRAIIKYNQNFAR